MKVIGDGIINCCKISAENKIYFSIITYIVKQMNIIICELQDKINVLNENILLSKSIMTSQYYGQIRTKHTDIKKN